MHSKRDNVKMMISSKEDEVMEELFQSFPSIFQTGLETSMKNIEFLFACVHSLYYKCYKCHGGLYTESPDWIKIKKQQ